MWAGGMSVKYEELAPKFVTTTGTLHDPCPSGGTWANLSRASQHIEVPPPTNPQWGKEYNLYSQFSATCFYFASALTDRLRAQGRKVPPIGLIESAVGGSKMKPGCRMLRWGSAAAKICKGRGSRRPAGSSTARWRLSST